MRYHEHIPTRELQQYVKCYYTLEYERSAVFEDQALATGSLEVMFTLSGESWETKVNGDFVGTSAIQLWGQVKQPLTFRISGPSHVFGIRFYPATAGIILREDISQFTDRIVDLTTLVTNAISELHAQLQEATSTEQRIIQTNNYLLGKINRDPKIINRINLVQEVMKDLSREDFFENIESVASRYGITSRYLQKIFLQHSGITPKLYSKIHRFQNSLLLLGQNKHSLTDVSYACGYFDQSHFIREFKSFTGFPPSSFDPTRSTAILASPNK